MNHKNDLAGISLSGGWVVWATVALIALVGLVRFDMILRVDYVRAPATYVAHVPGYDWNHRVVIVNVDAHDRVLRTSDQYIQLKPGAQACIRRSTMLMRRFTRYSLAMSPFCGGIVPTSLAAKASGA